MKGRVGTILRYSNLKLRNSEAEFKNGLPYIKITCTQNQSLSCTTSGRDLFTITTEVVGCAGGGGVLFDCRCFKQYIRATINITTTITTMIIAAITPPLNGGASVVELLKISVVDVSDTVGAIVFKLSKQLSV